MIGLFSTLHSRGPSTLQSIGFQPLFTNSSFALLKHLLPMKGEEVFVAPSGLGLKKTMSG